MAAGHQELAEWSMPGAAYVIEEDEVKAFDSLLGASNDR